MDGFDLSDGEKQRLGIARIFIRNPRYVVLDEATAHLDPKTEQDVRRSLKEFCKGRGTLLFAHQLGAISDAEMIYVLEGREVAECGTHDELMEIKGIYAKMWNLQNP